MILRSHLWIYLWELIERDVVPKVLPEINWQSIPLTDLPTPLDRSLSCGK
jgi:hypothetical protein